MIYAGEGFTGGESIGSPVPFDAIDQTLPIIDKLLIPRVPKVIGSVPNPDYFSLAPVGETGLLEEAALKNWYRGVLAQGPSVFPYYERGLQKSAPLLPTILAILDNYASHDPDLFNKRWQITFRDERASEFQPHGITNFHLDNWSEDRDSRIYLVADKHPTEFIVDRVELDSQRFTQRHDDRGADDYMFEALSEHVAEFPASVWCELEPYQIICLDESMPHRQPNTADLGARRALRAVFFEGPYSY